MSDFNFIYPPSRKIKTAKPAGLLYIIPYFLDETKYRSNEYQKNITIDKLPKF